MNELVSFFSKWKRYLFYIIGSSAIISLLLTGKLSDSYMSLILIPVCYIIAKFFILKNINTSDHFFLIQLFIVSFTICLISVFIFAYILEFYIGIPFLSYKDDFTYNESALQIVERWRQSGIGFYPDIRFSTGFYSGFPNVSAFFMYIFGDSVYVPRIANAFFSAITCLWAYRICLNYAERTKSRLVAVLFAVSPLLFIHSSLQLKDTILLFFTFGSIKATIDIFQRKKVLKNMFLFLICAVGIIFFRAATIIVIGGAILIYFIAAKANKRKGSALLSVIFIAIAFGGIFYSWQYLTSLEVINSYEMYFESRYDGMISTDLEDSNAGVAKLSIAKILGAPVYMLFCFFLPPASVVAFSDTDTINYTLFGLLFHYALLPFLVVAFIKVIRNWKKEPIALFILVSFFIFKLGLTNALLSALSPRQSLGSIYLMYLLLPFYFRKNANSQKIQKIVLLLSIMVLFAFALVRIYSRGLL